MKRITLAVTAALLVCGCGKDDNNANNGTNNSTANNGTVNNTANNGTSNNTTGNNGTNNTSGNNGTANNGSNNGTASYTPVEFVCDDVAPAGTLDQLVGTFDITTGCIGGDPFEDLYRICPTAVIPRADVTSLTGFVTMDDSYRFVNRGSVDVDVDVWIPDACSSQIGEGTCDAVTTTLNGLLDVAGVSGALTCADDAAGGCLCSGSASSVVLGAGLASSDADGALVLSEFDPDGVVVNDDWAFNTDGTTVQLQFLENGTSYDGTSGGAAVTDCDVYCAAFMNNCNEVTGVTGYADEADCLTQCGGFTVAGSEQTSGDNLECRLYHVFASIDTSDAGNRDVHCPHAQATATAPCTD